MQEQEHNEANSTFTDAHGICTFCLTSVLHCWFICEHVSTQCAWQTFKLTSWSRSLSNMREPSVPFLFSFFNFHLTAPITGCSNDGVKFMGVMFLEKLQRFLVVLLTRHDATNPSTLDALFFRCKATLRWLFNYLSFSVLGHISHLFSLTLFPGQCD